MVDCTINAKEHVNPNGDESWTVAINLSGFESKREFEKIYQQVRKQMRVISPEMKEGGE